MTATTEAPAESHDPAAVTPSAPAGVPMIYAAMAAVMADVDPVGKDGENQDQHYKFRAIEDVMKAAKKALVAHKVFYLPTVLTRVPEQRRTKSGSPMNVVHLEIRYTFYTVDGSHVEAVVWGEGSDTSDKATNKSMSAALKYNLVQALNIAAEDVLNDGDRVTVEAGRDESWRDSPPVNQSRRQQNGNGQHNGNARPAPRSLQPLPPDDPWYDAIAEIGSRDEANLRWDEIAKLLEANEISKVRADFLADHIKARVAQMGAAPAQAAPSDEAPAPPPPIREEDQGGRPAPPVTGTGEEGKWVADFYVRLAALTDISQVLPLQREIGQAIIDRKITSDVSKDLTKACRDRSRELELAAAGETAA